MIELDCLFFTELLFIYIAVPQTIQKAIIYVIIVFSMLWLCNYFLSYMILIHMKYLLASSYLLVNPYDTYYY